MEPGVRSPRRELCWPRGLAKHRHKPGGETSSSSCMPKHSREGWRRFRAREWCLRSDPANQPFSAFYPLRAWSRVGGCGAGIKQPCLKIKIYPTAPLPSISVPKQSLTGRGGPHSSLSSAQAVSGLCSQGHWKVSKGEDSSWEMPQAGYWETIPGRKKEAARVGGIWRLS